MQKSDVTFTKRFENRALPFTDMRWVCVKDVTFPVSVTLPERTGPWHFTCVTVLARVPRGVKEAARFLHVGASLAQVVASSPTVGGMVCHQPADGRGIPPGTNRYRPNIMPRKTPMKYLNV